MKKTIALLVLMLMLVSMTACGQDPAENGEPQTPGINADSQTPNSADAEPEITLPPEPVKQWYEDESVPMFSVKDRLDNNYDGSIVYYYNYKGDIVPNSDNGQFPAVYAKNGLALAYSPFTRKYGFADLEGNFAIEPIYDKASHFTPDGYATVAQIDKDAESYVYGVINSEGEEILPFVYDYLSDLNSYGYAVFYERTDLDVPNVKKYLRGVVDKTGKVVVEPVYSIINIVGDGWLMAKPATDEESLESTVGYSIYDFSGNVLCPCENLYEYRYTEEYLIDNERLWKVQEKIEKEENTIKAHVIWTYFDGEKFIKDPSKPEYEIQSKNVITTQSGVAYGINVNGENRIPHAYDNILEECGYYYCMKVMDGQNYTLDIYDMQFRKVAEGLPYGKLKGSPLRCKYVNTDYHRYLPEGYFIVNAVVGDEVASGVVDANGNIIVEVIHDSWPSAWCYENRNYIG